MSNPKFSILIPVYNQLGKMDECVGSIRKQTFDDYEVIFVDDGSDDGSAEMLKAFAAKDERYRIVTHEINRSLLCARFTGMKNAEGERVIFLDSDDYLEPGLLSGVSEFAKEHDTDVIRYGYIIEPKKIEVLPPQDIEPFTAFAKCTFPTAIMSGCFKRSVIKKAVELIDPPYVNSSEDTLMSAVLLSLCETYSNMDKAYYHYMMVGGMSRETNTLNFDKLNRTLESIRSCSECVTAYIDRYQPDKKELIYTAITNIYKFEMAHYILNTSDEKQAIDYLNTIKDERFPGAYEYACRVVLTEFFKRKLTDYEGNTRQFYGF